MIFNQLWVECTSEGRKDGGMKRWGGGRGRKRFPWQWWLNQSPSWLKPKGKCHSQRSCRIRNVTHRLIPWSCNRFSFSLSLSLLFFSFLPFFYVIYLDNRFVLFQIDSIYSDSLQDWGNCWCVHTTQPFIFDLSRKSIRLARSFHSLIEAIPGIWAIARESWKMFQKFSQRGPANQEQSPENVLIIPVKRPIENARRFR